MSINVDGSGAPYPDDGPIPLDELRALSWIDVRTRHTTRYPDLGRYLEDAEMAAAVAEFNAGTFVSDVPVTYIAALRTGTPDGSYSVTVNGTRVRFAVLLDRTTCMPDPARENDSWQQLRDIVATTTCAGIVLDLPQELALAIWERDGHEIWACRPGTPTGMLRKARQRRRRFTALSPLPLLGALGQTVTSGTCAASFAFAPVLPAVPLPDSDAGIFSRPPAAAAHPSPQRSWPLPGGVVRSDIFLPPVASPDSTQTETTPPTPLSSTTPTTPASPSTDQPRPKQSSPNPSPTGSQSAASPAPSPDEPKVETTNSAPGRPQQAEQPSPAANSEDNDERSQPRTEHHTSEDREHRHRPGRPHDHPRGHRGGHR